ncbi:hypothetical protein ACQKLX_23180 [Bosea sp. NPDC003192]|uniref:hypothetical protein n=1 Tax=Bosea sp. NPDC003192 TaxID=3390551 RepID=UPI003D03385F
MSKETKKMVPTTTVRVSRGLPMPPYEYQVVKVTTGSGNVHLPQEKGDGKKPRIFKSLQNLTLAS